MEKKDSRVCRIIDYDIIDSSFLEEIFTLKNKKSIVQIGLRMQKLSASGFDMELFAGQLENLTKTPEYDGKRTDSDADAAKIVWDHLRHFSFKLWADPGVLLWLALNCREYIFWRWKNKSNGLSVTRYDPRSSRSRDRHAIGRLFWAAKIVNGDSDLIDKLFANQDYALQILERAFSFVWPMSKWYLEYTQKPINEVLSDTEILAHPYTSDMRDVSILNEFNDAQHRQFIRIFYGLCSSQIYDHWSIEKFEEIFDVTLNHCLNMYIACKSAYEENTDNVGLSNTDLIEEISKLTEIPIDMDEWISNLE